MSWSPGDDETRLLAERFHTLPLKASSWKEDTASGSVVELVFNNLVPMAEFTKSKEVSDGKRFSERES